MHELRRGTYAFNDTSLPPLYYGTIDATPLWICLLHDAWRAGLRRGRGRRPAAGAGGRSALAGHVRRRRRRRLPASTSTPAGTDWPTRAGRTPATRSGSPTAGSPRVRSRSARCRGTRTRPRSAGRPCWRRSVATGAERYRDWAAALAEKFRAAFWCGEGDERFPALALDGDKQRVDSVTSNIGHLLGTGLLDARGGAAGGPPGRRGRSRLRARPADHVRPRRRLQPAQLPLRHGLAARHGDRDRRPGPGRATPISRAAWPRACCAPRWPSTADCPSCGPARGGPCPTRRPAAHRPGRPPRRSWSRRGRPLVSRSMR